MMEVNIPAVLDELAAAFRAYENALVGNDIDALNQMFWDNSLALRYGPREALYGHQQIADFRVKRGPVDQRRTLRETRLVTFGRSFGVANTEFVSASNARVGRQSQTWVRTDEGWRIVSAHVSFVQE